MPTSRSLPVPPITSQAELDALVAEARAAFARDKAAGWPWTPGMVAATQAAIRECQAELDARPRIFSSAHVQEYRRAVERRAAELERIAA